MEGWRDKANVKVTNIHIGDQTVDLVLVPIYAYEVDRSIIEKWVAVRSAHDGIDHLRSAGPVAHASMLHAWLMVSLEDNEYRTTHNRLQCAWREFRKSRNFMSIDGTTTTGMTKKELSDLAKRHP